MLCEKSTAFLQPVTVFNHSDYYWVASMANPVGICVSFVGFIYLFIYFFVLVKGLPVTPLLSGVFVHRAFCVYVLRIERVVGNA